MDLSSLEGPPIQDSRFNIPRIHLDIDSPIWPTTPIHPALRNNDLPPRPASSGADTTTTATPRYHRSTETPPPRPKSQEITSPTSILLHPVDGRGCWPLENPERRPRARSQPRPSINQHINSGDRLIWLDQERIWIRIEPGYSSTASENGKRTNGNPVPTTTTTTTTANNSNNNTRRTPTLSHSRSADSYLRGPPSINVDGTGMDIDMDMDDDDNDDLPPPYENHYYDPILTPQPARPLTRQNHCRGRGSPWSAVARRMNR